MSYQIVVRLLLATGVFPENLNRSVGNNRYVVYFTPISQVPEPSTYTMLLAGLVLVGFIASHRKNQKDTMNFA